MRNPTRPLQVCLLSAALGLIPGLIPLAAQNASLSGTVLDSQHSAVKDSEVTLVNVETKVTFRTASNESGRFLLPPVTPGHYEIK
jgi:hypothetical protein